MPPLLTIDSIRLRQVNLPPKVVRTDAIQSFVTQETVLLTLRCSDGMEATAVGAITSPALACVDTAKRQVADMFIKGSTT